jgi:hypothetical protein
MLISGSASSTAMIQHSDRDTRDLQKRRAVPGALI